MRPGEPFSAIVQSESMSYSSIVDRQRENADGSWFGVQARNDREGADQRDFFIFDGRGFTFLPGY